MKSIIRIVLILSLVFFQLNNSYCQDAENDTVFIKKTVHTDTLEIDTIIVAGGISPAQPQVLVGTTYLPGTNSMINLLNHGISPISLELAESCDSRVYPENFKDYPIFRKVVRDSTNLIIEVSVLANCCHHFLGDAEVIGDDTLNLKYVSYGGICSCECCFTLRYTFDTSMESYYEILNKVIINGCRNIAVIRSKQ